MKKEQNNSKKALGAQLKKCALKNVHFFLFAFLFLPNLSNAAVNKIISATIDPAQLNPITYGTSGFADYRINITTNNGSEAGISFLSLAGTALPQGCGFYCVNGSLTVIGNEVQLPAFMPSGDITLRITTAGVGGCFNITPPGTTNGIFAQLTSDPSPIQTGTCSLVVNKEALFFIVGGPLRADEKEYDGTTTATFSGGNLSGVNCADVVGFTASGNFTSANVGVDIPIITTFSLTGPDADKYTLIQPNLVGNIVRKTVNVTIDNLTKCEGSPSVYSGDEFTTFGFLNADGISSLTITCFGDDEFAASGTYPATASDPIGVGLDNYYVNITPGTLNNVAVPTILTTTPGSRCGSGTVVLGATASAGTILWYTDQVGGSTLGTGITFTTPEINETTSFWAEANIFGCTTPARVEVVATVNNCASQLAAGSCGKQLASMTEALYSEPVAGATNYRYWIQHPTTGFSTVATRNVNDNLFRLSWITTGIKYGSTYTVKVAAYVGGAWQAYGASCNITTPATRLTDANCGIVLSNISDVVYSLPVEGATNYRYRVENAASGFLKVSTRGAANNQFSLGWFSSGVESGRVYNVQVAAYVAGAWQAYGPVCTLTTPIPTTRLKTSSCNVTIPTINTALYSQKVTGATNYRYEVVNAATGFSKVSTRNVADTLFRLSWVSGIQLNTTYTIRVAAYVSGVWGAYSTACTVTTPAAIMADEEVVQEHNNGLSLGEELLLETYPNPNSGNFTLRSNTAGRFQLTNELGQVIRNIEISEETNYQATVEGLSQGIYFINAKKIVVQ